MATPRPNTPAAPVTYHAVCEPCRSICTNRQTNPCARASTATSDSRLLGAPTAAIKSDPNGLGRQRPCCLQGGIEPLLDIPRDRVEGGLNIDVILREGRGGGRSG